MNVVLVLIDSLNRRMLPPYGEEGAVEAPNLERFASRAWRFDNHFVGSLPCMPARREIFAGFKELMWRPWGPLEPFDARLPGLLEERGYATAIVTDHYHYWEEQANGYIQSFRGAELIRGHEMDAWKQPVPEDEPVPKWVENMERWRPGKGRRYYANVRDFRGEEDFFPARVMGGAARWLEENARKGPFFLQVESFDVHEPFDVPEPYASMCGDASMREGYNVWPPYQDPKALARFMANTTPEEIQFIRSQYMGKLTMVDRWFGELTARLDELSLWDDTVVIVTTDHGHDLGERETFGKQHPHYDSHANIPLFVWHPEHPAEEGWAISGLTQTVDLFASVLEAAGAEPPERTHSKSFLPLLRGEGDGREAVLYGTFGQGACVTDGEWTIFKAPEGGNHPLHYYSSAIFDSLTADSVRPAEECGLFIPGVGLTQFKVPVGAEPLSREDFLFHRAKDPWQEENLWEKKPEQRERMLGLLRRLMEGEGAPQEQYERLGLDRG